MDQSPCRTSLQRLIKLFESILIKYWVNIEYEMRCTTKIETCLLSFIRCLHHAFALLTDWFFKSNFKAFSSLAQLHWEFPTREKRKMMMMKQRSTSVRTNRELSDDWKWRIMSLQSTFVRKKTSQGSIVRLSSDQWRRQCSVKLWIRKVTCCEGNSHEYLTLSLHDFLDDVLNNARYEIGVFIGEERRSFF